MSKRNNEPPPCKLGGESYEQYRKRAENMYYDHLSGCDDCNYDRECTACYADGSYAPDVHSCNCSVHGYGVKLTRIFRRKGL